MEKAVAASRQGHAFVVVQPANWKIIPLENLIADFHRQAKRIYAYMKTKTEMEMAFSILEKGVDGIVVPAESLQAAAEIVVHPEEGGPLLAAVAKVTKIVDVGNGERACIDTASQLSVGEGLLIGSRASFFFLVHSETVPSEYIPTREFRVNAGAIHSYVLGEGDKTRYLSELKASDKVRTVDERRQVEAGRRREGQDREEAAHDDRGRPQTASVGTVMLQKAETIRLDPPRWFAGLGHRHQGRGRGPGPPDQEQGEALRRRGRRVHP